ncbi:SpoIIE family protein phosphatase [Streptomyces sp. NRRL WC-3549]|uniref:SpoIIE family protein phosphatase n=1 Tax=Streptomyces sp. NRRL WC-3549 TaxID=1463925 RepID=UPI000ABDA457|nr:SpoIIE family protein phosphatase [Streptomyces sp. NRRL WC-3549]
MADLLRSERRRAGGGTPGLLLEPLAGQDWGIWAADGNDGALGQALLDVLFSQTYIRLHVLDPELRVLRSGAPSAHEEAAESLLGRLFGEVCAFEEPERANACVREVLETGVPCIQQLFHLRPDTALGERRTLSMTALRLQARQGAREGERGPVLGVVVSMVDMTGQEKHRGREDILAAVRDNVGATLDIEATCRELVDTLVPAYADLGVVEVVDALLRGEAPQPGPLEQDVPLRRAAYKGRARPARRVGDVRTVVHGTPYQQALSDLRARIVPLTGELWADVDPEQARLIRAAGAHTLLVAPLILRGAVLGLVSLYRYGDSEPFTEQDIPVAEAVASRAALGIDNARRYVHEYTIVSALHRALLPQRQAEQPAVETEHLVLPGRDSGVWFDTIALPGARTALVIGEVTERGIHAATVMGQLRTVVQAFSALDLDPDELIARLYDTADLLAQERTQLPPSDPLYRRPLSATCMYAVYDPFSETCAVASAGHPAPLVIGPDGTADVADLPVGPLLGTADRGPVAEASLSLGEGSVLAFHSSALRSAAASASGALRQALAHPGRPLRDLCEAAADVLPDTPELRGAALLLARTQAMPADRYAAWELPYDKSAPATARRMVSERLAEWNLTGDTGEATELIVSELVTNAIRHGRPPLKLRLILDRGLTCEIWDGSTTVPHMKYAGVVDEGGRGLFIISQLATLWGTRYASEGKLVWSEQTLPQGRE